MDAETDAALTDLSLAIYRGPEVVQCEPRQVLYPLMYRLWAVTQRGVSPDQALVLAAGRTRPPHTMYDVVKAQLLVDWHIVSTYGLLTQQNLASMQAGSAPVATEGRFKGQIIDVVPISPLGQRYDLTNLALCPAGNVIPTDALPYRPASVASAATPVPGIVSTMVRPQSPPATIPRGPAAQRVSAIPKVPQENFAPSNMPVSTPKVTSGGIEVYDRSYNDVVAITADRALAVVRNDADKVLVSYIGFGPKVLVHGPAYDEYRPSIKKTSLPKTIPVHLQEVSGTAYLIHQEGELRYYLIDVTVNNGGSYRVAKVSAGP